MKNIKCIFDLDKTCNDCGECDRCDLDPKKNCDNCGKCLDIEKSDMRAVKVDEVVDDIKEALEYEEDLDLEDSKLGSEEEDAGINEGFGEGNEIWEYIDDIDGLNDILNDKENFERYAEEEYPGFIKLKKSKF